MKKIEKTAPVKCDFCHRKARYDAPLAKVGSWAYMCDGHWEDYGNKHAGFMAGYEFVYTEKIVQT